MKAESGSEAEGHALTTGLRHDFARLAMVADCTRCGYVAMLEPFPPHSPEEREA